MACEAARAHGTRHGPELQYKNARNPSQAARDIPMPIDKTEPEIVTIFGGSGFVGTRVSEVFARAGFRVRVAVRRPDLAGHIRMFGFPGQIEPIQANLRNAESVAAAVRRADVVVNLVGIGFERGRQRFRTVNTIGARIVAEAARAAGARALVHMSGLGFSPESESAFARSKAHGEVGVLEAFPQAVIIRPSIIFGPGDTFFNTIGSLSRFFPVLPLIGGDSRLQPVYVGDVADAFLGAAQEKVRGGRVYELGGPDIETNRELTRRILREVGRANLLMPLPRALALTMAGPMRLMPKPLISADQVLLLQRDNVVSEEAIRDKRTLAAFGVPATPMHAVLPSYLWRFRRHGQFDRLTA
jgi:NADH dehydrogenase